MKHRDLGKTGMKISEVSFGSWAIGAGWGTVDDKDSLAALHKAVDLGINFIDTADVYGMGHSEQLIAQMRKERSEQLYVATKAGRKLDPHVAEKYTPQNIRGFIQESLENLNDKWYTTFWGHTYHAWDEIQTVSALTELLPGRLGNRDGTTFQAMTIDYHRFMSKSINGCLKNGCFSTQQTYVRPTTRSRQAAEPRRSTSGDAWHGSELQSQRGGSYANCRHAN